ncbi:DUF4270 domain-containing protein [Mucilaginibacter achroorhodeus]|uniref:DUF4270 domain-containing protein n=1 Tax=Mucilaginibacter achroorhodeus TaxID=2599294 RepID=A0A563UAY5_9SPHI|nr:DUF4270 domain-containing protein [Mucilaginibacter achroorhodeus]TWR28508.1 DUF4270 domain-containing protein [Mucilaginibacter achroorhodeus]
MKFYKLGLLTLLISLFIFSSCKRQEGIGLDVDPANQINGTLLVDTSIVLTTVPEDTVVTNGVSARAPLSYFNDPLFGNTKADIGAMLNLPGTVAYTIPTGEISIDSAVLILPYASDGFYGDSLLSTFKVNVHQLSQNIVTTQNYYNTSQLTYASDIIGTKTFKARAHDTLQVYNIVKGKADTLAKVVPQVRVPISSSFVYTNLFNAPASILRSNAAYQNYVKGLYITLDKSGTTGIGGNMFFRVDTSAKVQVYYKLTTGGTTDTASLALPLSNNVNLIKHAYSSNVTAALNQTSKDGLVYLQGLVGLRSKITFPDVKNILGAVGKNAIINRAELVVNVAPGTGTPFAPNQQLTLYRLDLSRQRALLQDASPSDPRNAQVFGGRYDANENAYHFLITAYLQDLISGKSVDYGTYLAPVTPSPATTSTQQTVNIGVTSTYAQRTVIVGKNGANRARINIYYTKINP